MSSRFAVGLLAALLAPAVTLAAGSTAAYDDVQYPDVSATFATSSSVIDAGDVVYPSAPLTITSMPRPSSEDTIARFDDVTYPTANEPARAAASPQRSAQARDADTSLACHCAQR